MTQSPSFAKVLQPEVSTNHEQFQYYKTAASQRGCHKTAASQRVSHKLRFSCVRSEVNVSIAACRPCGCVGVLHPQSTLHLWARHRARRWLEAIQRSGRVPYRHLCPMSYTLALPKGRPCTRRLRWPILPVYACPGWIAKAHDASTPDSSPPSYPRSTRHGDHKQISGDSKSPGLGSSQQKGSGREPSQKTSLQLAKAPATHRHCTCLLPIWTAPERSPAAEKAWRTMKIALWILWKNLEQISKSGKPGHAKDLVEIKRRHKENHRTRYGSWEDRKGKRAVAKTLATSRRYMSKFSACSACTTAS